MSDDLYTSTQKNGSAYYYTFDLTKRCQGLKTTVSSAVWAVSSGTSIAVSSDSNTNLTCKALCTASSTGVTVLTCTVTYASGEISVLTLTITVT